MVLKIQRNTLIKINMLMPSYKNLVLVLCVSVLTKGSE